MNSNQIIQLIRESTVMLSQDFDGLALSEVDSAPRTYDKEEISEFIRDLTDAANKQRVIYLENRLTEAGFSQFMAQMEMPIIAFQEKGDGLVPVILFKKKRKLKVLQVNGENPVEIEAGDLYFQELYKEEGKIIFMGVFSYKSLVSDDPDAGEDHKHLNPVQRLLRLLSEEKKDIFYIYTYAVLIGLISLTLPLGIQATVSLISGGVIFSSVYVLIGLVIAGVLASGGLQIMQMTLVEYLQRRVFTKAAFEFAFRVPRIKPEALSQYHAPELMNRFFDVLTLQKGLPKLLINLSLAAVQILFGLLLLSFYHPFFVFFSMLLALTLFLIFYISGPKGLQSSINESKYKYKVVYWLEELARTISSFKLSGNTALPLRKTDYNVNNYLKNRKIHFGVLIGQYSFILLFKALVTGGLLIMGTLLVVDREITLGQFVASEVIIILILGSVEKIIMYMDVVYDLLTAVDKIAQVTDLPLERSGGLDIPKSADPRGFEIKIKKLKSRFSSRGGYFIQDVSIDIRSGESLCISGEGGAGKTLLTNTIAGLNDHYEGIITMDGFSLRDLDLMNLRDKIGKNVSQEDIFEGTIIENILLAKPNALPSDALWAIDKVGIADQINALPHGLDTPMVSGGKGLPSSLVDKVILARCLAKRPRLLIINDLFNHFFKTERLQLLQTLLHPENPWTLIIVSNDPLVMSACDRMVLLEAGRIKRMGTFGDVVKSGELASIID